MLQTIQQAYPHAKLTAGDLFEHGLHISKNRVPSCEFLQVDARKLPFESEFDVVGAFDVIEHITEDTEVLSQIYTALKPDGIGIFTVPQHPTLWSVYDEQAAHKRRYKIGEIENKARAVGCEIQYTTSFVCLVLPLMVVSRFRKRYSRKPIDNFQEFHISKTLNAVLDLVMRFEFVLLRWGLKFRAGGSRLLVARLC